MQKGSNQQAAPPRCVRVGDIARVKTIMNETEGR
jgi:ribosomal protein L29